MVQHIPVLRKIISVKIVPCTKLVLARTFIMLRDQMFDLVTDVIKQDNGA